VAELEIRGGLHADMWRLFGYEIGVGALGLCLFTVALIDVLDGSLSLAGLLLGGAGLSAIVVTAYGGWQRLERLKFDGMLVRLDDSGVCVTHGAHDDRRLARTTWDNVAAVVVREAPHYGSRVPGTVVQFMPKRPALVEGDTSDTSETARILGGSQEMALLSWPLPRHHGLSPEPVVAYVREHHPDVRIEDWR
jgi:hypothetical protein